MSNWNDSSDNPVADLQKIRQILQNHKPSTVYLTPTWVVTLLKAYGLLS